MKFIRKYIIAGILIVFPILITTNLFMWLFKSLDGILGPVVNRYLMDNYGYTLPGLGILVGLIITFFVGFFVTHLISRRILAFFENCFIRFPVIKQVYPAVKQMTRFLFTDTKAAFRKTVLIEYPRKGIYTLCFITNEAIEHFNQKTNSELVNIFVPSTPGPLTGYTIMIRKEEVIVVDISVEDALKMLVSGGVVNPSVT